MFLDNKYARVYSRLMYLANVRTIGGYTERYHIIPKCLGGADNKDNLVRLSAREHYIAHLLLCKMTEGAAQRKMAFTFSRMNGQSRTHQCDLPPSRWYEYSKETVVRDAKEQNSIKRNACIDRYDRK